MRWSSTGDVRAGAVVSPVSPGWLRVAQEIDADVIDLPVDRFLALPSVVKTSWSRARSLSGARQETIGVVVTARHQ